MGKTYLERKIKEISEYRTRKINSELLKFMGKNDFEKMLRVNIDRNMTRLVSFYTSEISNTIHKQNIDAQYSNLIDEYNKFLQENTTK